MFGKGRTDRVSFGFEYLLTAYPQAGSLLLWNRFITCRIRMVIPVFGVLWRFQELIREYHFPKGLLLVEAPGLFFLFFFGFFCVCFLTFPYL